MSLLWGSNPGPSHYKCDALPLCKKGFNDSYIMLYSSNTYNIFSLSCFLNNIYILKIQSSLKPRARPQTISQET